ncbi:inorganic phosphate transporter, PiT family [Algoriella xinjiangensis]|uniref:Phosphate transporter n=1 Tax=Algoriella xinjiangensis TaxID=684065 RepID=A0A1I4VIY2_9FLAO|nr:inorganic phosphate transporter [Algoriella xinjiangensis]SFN01103.1 inorganic phosphate transporter, PiT family [Algoriella xinjiangensis]VDH17196.1 Low-affinity inorganic phosphate transporter 1 [Algoriella xinjiangensis]
MHLTVLFIIIGLAILFDFLNGFHDAANSIATVVTTKVLTPLQAVIWAAFFNFVAFFIAKYIIGEFGVADTIAKIIKEDVVVAFGANPSVVVIAALSAAIVWNLLTWKLGIPSSSSHTLIGGLAGGALAATGYDFSAINSTIILTIIAFILVAPIIGLIAGNIIYIITLNLCRNAKPHKADSWFKKLQLVSSALLSIGHGLNDSQKVMGVITFALLANQTAILNTDMDSWILNDVFHWKNWFITTNSKDIHDWVPIVCFSAIALGTLGGGMKILKTMGNKITKITPIEGFTAQTASAITLFFTEHIKMPVSTTHVITGSIIGVGMVKRVSAVRWGVTISLLWAWILTIPVSALLATAFYHLIILFF